MSAAWKQWPVPTPRRRPVDIIADVMRKQGVEDEVLCVDMAVSALAALRSAGYAVSAAAERPTGWN
jgi:hypothetical protein